MIKVISRGLRAASEILLPRTCIVCGESLLLDEEHLCLECLADLPQTYFWQRSHNQMADKFNEVIQRKEHESFERYAYAAALFFYHSEADYRLIPYQIKYHGNLSAGMFFGKMLGRRLASSDIYSDVDMVIPVPLHWTRKWQRGYNQAEVIAEGVAEAMKIPLRTDILKRCRRTATQTKLTVEDKTRNVSGAFTISDEYIPRKDIRHILLIDDVFTTGSTSASCLSALRSAFPPEVRISIATLAFVGRA